MHMRKKKWARPELAACPFYINGGEAYRDTWKQRFRDPEKPLRRSRRPDRRRSRLPRRRLLCPSAAVTERRTEQKSSPPGELMSVCVSVTARKGYGSKRCGRQAQSVLMLRPPSPGASSAFWGGRAGAGRRSP